MGQHEEDKGFLIRLSLSVQQDHDINDTFAPTKLLTTIVIHKLPVLRRTPKGVWIKALNGKERFVLLEGKKRYAYPTMKEAYDSFIIRKARERVALIQRLNGLKKLPYNKELREQLCDKIIASGHDEIQL